MYDASIRSFALRFEILADRKLNRPGERTSRLLTGEIKSVHGVQICKTSLIIREYGENTESVYGERQGAEIVVECEHQTKLSRCTSTCAYRNLILARVFSLHNQSYIPRVTSSLPVALDNATDGNLRCHRVNKSRLHIQTYRADFFRTNLNSRLKQSFFIN